MDKQKQIEEMARTLTTCERNSCVGCGRECIDYRMAKAIYNAGYRKIPEGAVVLTGTETEECLEDLLTEFDEMSFYPATLMPNAEECAREWKRKLIYAIGQLRKETAEKFAERVKMAFYYEFDELIPSIMADKIDEICKEITEGKANASKTKL